MGHAAVNMWAADRLKFMLILLTCIVETQAQHEILAYFVGRLDHCSGGIRVP